MDQRWFEHFSCLEALFLAKSLEKSDLTFQTVQISAKSPPAGAVKGSEPFILPKSADRPVDQHLDRPVMATDQAHVEAQHDSPTIVISDQQTDQPSTNQIHVGLHQSQVHLVYTLPRTPVRIKF